MKKAFTLIELIVVVGIIVILIGTLLASLAGGTESARTAKCLTNMKNLATACNSCAMVSGSYPLAGSIEVRKRAMAMDKSNEGGMRLTFSECKGWLSWDSRNAYPAGGGSSHTSSGGWFTSAYSKDADARLHALTNGAIWRYVSESSDVFVCPSHRNAMRSQNPLWSYVMNEIFGYDSSMGSQGLLFWQPQALGDIRLHSDSNKPLLLPDRVLMFSELQFLGNDMVQVNTDESPGFRNDCTLQYSKNNEIIGFNHPNGKHGIFAHVAFADGHVEKLHIPALPSGGGWAIQIGQNDLKDLTKWLCEGKDVTFNGKRYEVKEN